MGRRTAVFLLSVFGVGCGASGDAAPDAGASPADVELSPGDSGFVRDQGFPDSGVDVGVGPTVYRLTVEVFGPGSVTGDPIDADGKQLDCQQGAGVCELELEANTEVVLTAGPDALGQVAGWGGACREIAAEMPCTLVLDGPKAVSATFEPQERTVTVLRDTYPMCGGRVRSVPAAIDCGDNDGPCAASFPIGTSVTLQASAEVDGPAFEMFSEDCAGASCELTVPETGANVGAVFSLPLDVAIEGQGLVRSASGLDCLPGGAGTCSTRLVCGQTTQLEAEAAPGNAFVGWSGDCAGAGRTCDLDMRMARTSTARFAPIHRVEIAINGPGSLSVPPGFTCSPTLCSGTVVQGTVVRLEAIPSSAQSAFLGFSGDCMATTSVCEFTVVGPSSVAAAFGHEVELTFNQGGTIDEGGRLTCTLGRCRGFVAEGTQLTLRERPDPGFTLISATGSCTSFPCTVVVDRPISVEAVFGYAIQIDLTGNGAGVRANVPLSCVGNRCTGAVRTGFALDVQPNPATGAALVEFSGDCQGTTCAFTPTRAVQIAARFGVRVELEVDGPGTITHPTRCATSRSCLFGVPQGNTVDVRFDLAPGAGVIRASNPDCVGRTCRLTVQNPIVVDVESGWTVSVEKPAGIRVTDTFWLTCPSASRRCTEVIPDGIRVNFTATSTLPYWRIDSWANGCSSSATPSVCNTTVTSGLNLVITARLEPWTLRIERRGTGVQPVGVLWYHGGTQQARNDACTAATCEILWLPDDGLQVISWAWALSSRAPIHTYTPAGDARGTQIVNGPTSPVTELSVWPTQSSTLTVTF